MANQKIMNALPGRVDDGPGIRRPREAVAVAEDIFGKAAGDVTDRSAGGRNEGNIALFEIVDGAALRVEGDPLAVGRVRRLAIATGLCDERFRRERFQVNGIEIRL